jgi:cell division protein FtsI (penicillin-binding protein 3)
MPSDARTVRPSSGVRAPQARPSAPGGTRPPGRPAPRTLEVPPPGRTRGGGGRRSGGRGRLGFLAIAIGVVLAVFAVKLVVVQGVQGASTAAKAREARLTSVTTLGLRGEITDAHGVTLAASVIRYDVAVDQRLMGKFRSSTAGVPDGAAGVAALLAPLLAEDAAELGGELVGTRPFKYLKKDVLPDVARQIRKLNLPGITVDQVADRVYPNGALAGNVIGFVNSSGSGLAGLEQQYDARLEGTPGVDEYERGRHGQQIPGGYEKDTPAQPGDSLQLTIDADLQYAAESALADQLKATGAPSGTVIVVDVKTGEVLAMADSKKVDPNDPGDQVGSLTPAISDVFEPGSTGKVVTMANVLEHGIATPTSQFTVPYSYTTANGQTFHDAEEHGLEKLTTTGVLAESSNAGTVMIGQQLTKQQRYDYLAKFGFGTKTGIELPGESKGILHPVDAWDGRSEFAALFGQSLSVTALQAVEVFATVANGGVRVQPHIVKGWTSADGTFTAAPAAATTRVIQPTTAKTLLTMMQSVVNEGGTGTNAAIPGYLVAGKTGTAQSWEANGRQGITSSFIGVAPADEPRVAVAVILHDPKSSVFGGVVAAPVFKEVAGYALQRLGVAPSGAKATLFPTTW